MRICTLQTLLLVITLLLAVPLSAQHDNAPKAVASASSATSAKPLPQIFEVIQSAFGNDQVSNAVLLRLKKDQLPTLLQRLQKEQGRVLLELPAANGQVMAFDLEKNKLLTEDFKVQTPVGTYPYTPGQYLKGKVKGLPQSLAAISVFDNLVMGVISTEAGNYVLGPLRTVNGIPSDEYILYNEKDLKISNEFACHTDELEEVIRPKKSSTGIEKNVLAAVVKVYFECDFKMYQERSSNSTNVANFVTGAYNAVSTIYSNESILTQISQIFVWTTQDPYRSTSSSDALTDFRTRLNTNGFNGDIAHLLSRATGNLGGVAYVDVLCERSYAYAYSNIASTYQNFPTYSWTVNVITHEMGHNLGSPHTQSCTWPGGPIDNCYCPEGSCSAGPEPPATGGTIMSYCHLNGNTTSCTLPSGSNPGVNLSAGFGPLPGDLIRNRVSLASCLEGATPTPNLTAASGTLSVNGSTINATISVTNNGAAAAGASTVGFYLSTDNIFNTSDPLIATRAIPALANGATSGSIVVSMDVATVSGVTPGTYFVLFFIDKDNAVGESNENDNNFYWNSPQVTIASSCATPTNSQITVTNLTTSSARFNCLVTGVTQYDWQYRVVGATSWTSVAESTATFFNASGLSAGTAYEVQVRVQCGTTWSLWSPSLVFSTTAAACSAPTTTQINATNIATTSAQLTCSITGVNRYDWQYRRSGTTTWTAVADGTAAAYTATGLTANTAYEFQVRVQCGTTWSAWSASKTFTTSATATCAAPTTTQIDATNIATTSAQLTCSITGVNRYDWQYRRSGTTTWTAVADGTAAAYTANGLTANTTYEFQVRVQCGTTWSAWSSSKTFTTSATATCAAPTTTQIDAISITTTSAQLTCSITGVNRYDWQYRRSGTTTWTAVADGTAATYTANGLTANTTYEFQMRIRCNTTWSAWSASKTFTTSATATCAAPTTAQIDATSITTTTAQLTCSITGVTRYDWQYRRSGTTTWTAVADGTAAAYTATGLTANTTYEFQVRVQCGTTWSAWSASKTFTTSATATCAAPTTAQIDATSITTTSAQLTCSITGVTRYDWQYRRSGTTTWTAVADGAAATYTANGLTANTTYEFQMRIRCNTTWSAWSASKTFTTSATATCAAPTTAQINATNIATTSAQLTCSVTGVNRYDWQYRRSGTTTWTAVADGTAAAYTATGLTANTTYEFQVRVQCGTTWSAWSSSKTFTTSTAVTCSTPTSSQTSATNIASTTARLNHSLTGYSSYGWRYRRSGSLSWTTLTSTTNYQDLTGLTRNTRYEFQVRIFCNNAWTSWTSTKTFTTTSSLEGPDTSPIVTDGIVPPVDHFQTDWELKAYPQPVTDVLSLELRLLEENQLRVSIYDLTGKLMKTMPLGIFTPGAYTTQLTLDAMRPGIYLLQVTGNQYNKQLKIVIQ